MQLLQTLSGFFVAVFNYNIKRRNQIINKMKSDKSGVGVKSLKKIVDIFKQISIKKKPT